MMRVPRVAMAVAVLALAGVAATPAPVSALVLRAFLMNLESLRCATAFGALRSP